MSDDSFDASAKGRTTESGAALARGRDRHGGGGHGVVEDIWLVATASLSLPRAGASGDACAGCGKLGNDHTEDAAEPRPRLARLRDQARHHDKRGHSAGDSGFPDGKAAAWLRRGRYGAPFISNSHLIGCSLPSSNRLTTCWLPDRVRVPASTSGSASTSPFSEPARRSLRVAARMLAESPK